jgi:glutathione synthase/RimK-type ligase-like ATP-grasp enzyme
VNPRSEDAFLGLAPFLRKSIAGIDLRPIGQEMLERAEHSPDDANRWMNLSVVMFCLGLRDVGLAIQNQALALKRVFHLAAARQPARLRLLMLMVPGDIAANTPLDCLLEDSDIDLEFYYVTPGDPLAAPLPEHDALIVGISECDENRTLLCSLEHTLTCWPRPVINAPQNIPATGRMAASQILQNAPGLLIPPTRRAPRSQLLAIASGDTSLHALFDAIDFPLIVRPVGSHGGHGLDKVDRPDELTAYLALVDGQEFFLSPFIDYSGTDGLFRKCRIALIDGEAYACHQGISSHWMIHYLNAGMYEDAWKRAEESAFMTHFDDFAQRHRLALDAIYRRTKLDYVCVDCAETRDGQLLVFEIDHAMVVHAMDTDELFPYKQGKMQRVKNAFRDFLFRLTCDQADRMPKVVSSASLVTDQ